MKTKLYVSSLAFITLSIILLGACSPADMGIEVPTSTSMPTELVTDEPANIWSSLLEVTPVPYASPLPNPARTVLDGIYVKYDPSPPQWWACLRCADYRQAGGIWRIQFDQGVMRIYYEVTGWHSLASYTVSGDRLFLFNDPYCKEATGEYKWSLADGNLALEVIDDPCSFDLRGKNLSRQAWAACQIDGVLVEEPRGCTDSVVETAATPILPSSLKLTVHEADVRLTPPSPDVIINASGTDQSPPENVRLSFSDESLLYGTNRVLWTDDDWLEVVTDASFKSIGVQFRGDYVIGWARVLFNGQEVWRGDTSKIWSETKIHGGYIEVSGFEPGKHTLRVERLGVDSRPVVVAFFGFNR